MPRVGLRLRVRLGAQLPLDLIPDGDAIDILAPDARWRGDQGIAQDDAAGRVSGWTSTNGLYTLTQTLTAEQPTYASSDADYIGKPSVGFSAASKYWLWRDGADLASIMEGNFTVMVASRVTDASAFRILWSTCDVSSSTARMHMGTDTTPNASGQRLTGGATTYNSATVSNTTSYHQWMYQYDGSGMNFRHDGTADSAAGVKAITGQDRFAIGALMITGSDSVWHNGSIAELAIWSRALSAVEAASVESFWTGYYGAPT